MLNSVSYYTNDETDHNNVFFYKNIQPTSNVGVITGSSRGLKDTPFAANDDRTKTNTNNPTFKINYK